ncbi:MAG: efflux RND transporter periplasmic adaptor subunit [Crocinitomicaceae bacterium]|nr:efflux RND transporter periplasmic adaptor subunit [Crocinitomicaceae bacterium]
MKTIIGISILLLVLSACSSSAPEQMKQPRVETNISLNAEQLNNAGVEYGTATLKSIGLLIQANGKIEVPPQNKTIIAAQFGGFIKSVKVLDGMLVQKGQTLFTIEDPLLIELQQDFIEVMGNLEFLSAELERQTSLVKQEAGSLKTYQQAKSNFVAAQARKNGLKAKLAMAGLSLSKLNNGTIQSEIPIVAPFSGVVTKLTLSVGSYADPKDHLMEIIDLKHAHAEVIVFEKDLKHLKVGQTVQLALTDNSEMVTGKVFLIGKEVAQDRTVLVHCHLDKENSTIAPGSYFKAIIRTGTSEEYCLPSDAIVELNNKKVVFIPTKKGKVTTFNPEEVHVLSTENEWTAFEFKSKKIKLNQRVVTKGAYDILSTFLMKAEE